jgi:signal peptidase I
VEILNRLTSGGAPAAPGSPLGLNRRARSARMISPRPGRVLRVVALAATAVAVVGWVLFLRPQTLGGPAAYIMVSGESMEPTYYNGDFVVSRKQTSYEPGDIVVFRVPKGEVGEGRHVIHRIIGGSSTTGFTTQGDNRSSPDLWRPTNEDVVGEAWFRVPGAVSRWLPLLRTPLALGLFAGLWAYWVAIAPRKNEGTRRTAPPPSHPPPPPPPHARPAQAASRVSNSDI